jgi:hypothetical protein
MAIQKEIWAQDIQDVLFQGLEFTERALNHNMFISGKTVHVPQAGANPSIVVNRTSFPATIATRTDTTKEYSMKSLTTDPIVVTDVDELQTSYDKRKSVLASHTNVLTERAGLEIIHGWAGTVANKVATTGTADALALAPSATGTRNALMMKDIRACAKLMDKQGVPKIGRMLILPSDMYYQLFDDANASKRDAMNANPLLDGIIDRIFGFDIYSVGIANRLTSALALRAVTHAGASTDHFAGIACHADHVSRAMGAIKVFAEVEKADYYGGVMSAEVMIGSSALRTSEAGVITLHQV